MKFTLLFFGVLILFCGCSRYDFYSSHVFGTPSKKAHYKYFKKFDEWHSTCREGVYEIALNHSVIDSIFEYEPIRIDPIMTHKSLDCSGLYEAFISREKHSIPPIYFYVNYEGQIQEVYGSTASAISVYDFYWMYLELSDELGLSRKDQRNLLMAIAESSYVSVGNGNF